MALRFTSANALYCITINIYDLRHNIYIYISCSLFITFTPYTQSLRLSCTPFGLVFSLLCFVLLTIFSTHCRDFFSVVLFFVLFIGFDFAIYFHFITFTFIPIHFQFYSTFSEQRHCYSLPNRGPLVFSLSHTHIEIQFCTPLDFKTYYTRPLDI